MSVPTRPAADHRQAAAGQGPACLSLVYRHQTRDITRNLPLDQAQRWWPSCCRKLPQRPPVRCGEVQLTFSKKGKPMLQRHLAHRRPVRRRQRA
jgi:hypothetical protein